MIIVLVTSAYLDASAALVIASTVTTIISSLTYMLPWLASIGQVITGGR
jgi:energy-converting hydrogenase Eha subunit C